MHNNKKGQERTEKFFALKVPCSECPFRSDDKAIGLRDGRREEIIEGLLSQESQTFSCHKTIHRPDGRNYDSDGRYAPVDISYCPGAIAVVKKFGRDVVAVQLGVRLGVIQEDHYDKALELTIDPCDLAINKKRARI